MVGRGIVERKDEEAGRFRWLQLHLVGPKQGKENILQSSQW